MQIQMENTEALAPERIDDFLQATAEIDFAGQGRRGVYESGSRPLWSKRRVAVGDGAGSGF
jgi:hypothetical protein